MPGSNAAANDEMIRRLDTELREKKAFADEIVHRAQSAERDLTEDEKGLIGETRGRMEAIRSQLDTVEDISRVSYEAASRARQVGSAIEQMKGVNRMASGSPVEYRCAGEYVLDMYNSAMGKRESSERLEVYHRAAAHDFTSDAPGLLPLPILQPVINFIDAARPLVNFLGPRAMPSQTWSRPLVTQHTAVAIQGTAGQAADEKTELVSQKMTISKLTAEAVTYGGYVNVSRQFIDFTVPEGLDIVINDLAAQFAIETEAALGTAVSGVSTPPVDYVKAPTTGTAQTSLATAIWGAAAQVYTAVRGQGRLGIVVSPDMLATFGALFAPYGPFNQYGEGFNAANFGQGVMGNITGIPTIMSAGLTTGKAFVFSTAALEVYEQRVGALQVVEPSVLGLQVAYAGYFAPLLINAAGIVPIVGT